MNDILEKAKFNAEGLIPAIVQDVHTREILMLAYMNEEALRLTLQRRETYFWSRSRQELWHKGATSGNSQKVVKSSRADRHVTPVHIPAFKWSLRWKVS